MGKKKYLAVKPLSPDHAKRVAPLPSFPPSNPSSPVRENRPIVSPPPQLVAQPASSGVSPPKSAHRTEEDGAAVANSQRPRPAALQQVGGPPRSAALPAPEPLVRTPHLQKPLVHSALAPHQHHAHAPPAAGAQPAQAGRPSAFDAAVKPHHPHAQPLRQHVPAVVDGQVIGQPHHAHDQHHAHGQAHMHPTHAHHQPHGTGHVPHSALKTAAPLPPQAGAPLPAPAASSRAPSPQPAARAQTTSPTPRPIYESHVEAPSQPAPAATSSVPPAASPRPAHGGPPPAAASAATPGAGAPRSAADEKTLKAKQKKLKALASEASSGGSSGKNGKRKQGLMSRLFCARPKTFDEKHGGAADYVKIEQYEAKNPHAKPSPQAAANASQTARTATPQTQTMSNKPPPQQQQPRQQQPPQQQQQQQQPPRQHMSATQQWLMQQQQQIHQLAQQQQQQPPRHYPAPGYPPASSHGYPQPQQHHPLQPTPLGTQQQPQPLRPVPYHIAMLQQGAPKEKFAVV
jgi:hypothetical protein